MIPVFEDTRQSPGWGNMLSLLGWKIVRTSTNVQVALYKTLFGTLVKIQRPHALTKEDLGEIDKLCKKAGALFVKIEPGRDQDISLLDQAGYAFSDMPLIPTKTMVMDLTKSPDEMWGLLSHSAKYSVNRAMREGVKFKFVTQPDEALLREFYPLQKMTGKKKGFFVEPFKHLMYKTQSFGKACHVALVYNSYGGLEGGKFFAGYNKSVVYLTGGTSEGGRKSKSGYLLTWQSFLRLKNCGYDYLDMEGLDDKRFPGFTKGWGGFSHFKEKFGGEPVEFNRPRVKYYSPLFAFMAKVSPLRM